MADDNQFPKSDITDKIYKPDKNGEIEELISSRKKFKSLYKKVSNNKKQNAPPSLCFFLKAVDINILANIPNFQGINIAIGLDKNNQEQLIMVPVIKGSDPQNVYNQTFTVNGETKTTSTVVELAPSPCPPYPHGCNNCLCT
jgi:hypothetical protein